MAKISNQVTKQAARIAGITYILVILIGILKVSFIEPMVTGEGPDAAVALAANATLFRIGVACELLMYVLVVVLSLALYVIARPISKVLALSALLFRFGEAIIGSVSVLLSGVIPLLLYPPVRGRYSK